MLKINAVFWDPKEEVARKMLRYVLKRLLICIPVIFCVAVLIFTLMYFTPGDPAVMALGTSVSPEELETFREYAGLNDPYIVRLGESWIVCTNVSTEIANRMPITVRIAVFTVVVSTVIGVPLGVLATVHQDGIADKIVLVLSSVLRCIPNFWIGLMLITHNLGIVAELCDNVAVVYGGEIVEYGSRREIFKDPCHPYTIGLFGALPDLDGEKDSLTPIEGIGRAISLRPKFIVCDEPVSALDVSIQAQIVNLLKDLQKDFGIIYMFVSHDMSVVRLVSHNISVMYLGQLVETASYDELFDKPLHPYTKALLSAIPSIDIDRPKKRH